jgi:hypothetical protein
MRYTNILVRLSVKKAAIFAAIKGLPGWNVPANGAPHPLEITDSSRQSGRSSGVEHNLAKVGVEGSNPFLTAPDREVKKTRTSTGFRPQRPQRCASTNSAMTALP